jgi:hypothetical protein
LTTDALIQALLATGQMNEETTADLGRWLEEFKAGTLHPDDAAYIAALHARTTGDAAALEAMEPIGASDRLDGFDIHGWRERALAAEAELAALKDQLANPAAL